MMARSAPTGTVSSSLTRILVRVPATGEGISVSTLSVETSSSGSSTATSSPSAFSQRVTVPSVTDSPSAGIVTVSPPPWPPPCSPEDCSPEDCCGCSACCCACSGSEVAGCSGCSVDGASAAGASSACGSAAGCCSAPPCSAPPCSAPPCSPDAAEPSPMTARSAPTGTVSSSLTRISCSTPATGEGISVSTLSVETSSSGSSTATVSPTFFSQRVTVPSVTDSPRAGMVTRSDMGSYLLVVLRWLRFESRGVSRVRRARGGACRPGPCGPLPAPRSGSGGRGPGSPRRRAGPPSCR